MDSGNSGSISSSGDEEYDSRADHSVFLNHPTHFGSSYHPSMFNLSSTYPHSLPQSQPISTPQYSLLNLDTATSHAQRSELANCTDPATLPSSSSAGMSHHQALNHDDNARLLLSSSAPPTSNNNIVARNSKKRTRASRRAPTTVLTTDTTNFRSMVQEFTGIPSPPFSASSPYSRRLDLLATSSSLRSSASHLDTTNTAFHPLRPFAQKVHPNPLLNSRLLHSNMVDAMASTTTNASSSATANNSVNFHLPPDLGLPYQQRQNMNLSMQNNPILAFNPPPITLHTPFNTVPAGFGAKFQPSLSMPSLEDLGMSHGHQANAHLVATDGLSVAPGHEHVASEGMPLMRSANGDGTIKDPFRSLDGKVAASGSGCKLNFSASASSSGLNHEKLTLESASTRGEGTVDSWICSSD